MSIESVSTITAKPGPTAAVSASGKTIHTCPMHPEVQQQRPGDCPKCGRTLEPKMVTGATNEVENTELHDMTKRLWIGAVLTLPVFVLAMAHLFPALGRQPWVDGPSQAGCNLRSPHPWSGGPAGHFSFGAGVPSVTRQLNMFTLIAIGVGAAYLLMPGDALVSREEQQLGCQPRTSPDYRKFANYTAFSSIPRSAKRA